MSPEYQKDMNEEIMKLQRLYGGGDLTKFPDFKFEGESTVLCTNSTFISMQVRNSVVGWRPFLFPC